MIGVELNAMLSNLNSSDIAKGIIKDMRFIDYAEVTAVNKRYVDLKRKDVVMTNVEVISLGCNGYSINLVPKVGDYVLVFSSRTFIKDTATLEQDTAVDSYSAPTLKCLPICSSGSEAAISLITIDENGFTFNDTADSGESDKHNTILINKDGISITDRNGNTAIMNEDGITVTDVPDNDKVSSVVMSADGIKVTDRFDSSVTTTKDGIAVEDTNKNKITCGSKGIAVEDTNKNKITCDSKGIAVEDTNKNKITLSSDGFSISDSSNNKIVSSSSGLTITDKNSKKIEMSASGTVINGKLTVL